MLGWGFPAMLLYTPAVRTDDFDVAISYLFRRLEENASDDNFLRHLFDLEPGSASFEGQEAIFRRSVADRHRAGDRPRRTQNRFSTPRRAYEPGQPFRNEPDTDPILEPNRHWISTVLTKVPTPVSKPLATAVEEVDALLTQVRFAQPAWGRTTLTERQQTLHRIGDELADTGC